MDVLIPKVNDDYSNAPAWCPTVKRKKEHEGKIGSYTEHPDWYEEARPSILCRCGWHTSIRNHHIHSDGKVTASYFHSKASDPERGCDWHVYLTLEGYDGKEWKPGEE